MIKLSAVVITFNEEKNIARCIESLRPVADEIIIVDSLSTDKTKEICEHYQVRFIEQKFLGYVEQKNFAMQLASFEHVLSLDADEALDEHLQDEILKIKKDFKCDGYKFNRLTQYVDQWIWHCGWYPDTKLRIVKKNIAKWVGDNPHDALEVQGTVAHIEGNLLHYSYDSISGHVLQSDRFSSIEAQSLFKRGKKATLTKFVTRPLFQFFKDYILKKGFLDGRYGFIICCLNSLYVFLKYAKMIDLERLNKNIK